MNYTTYTVEAPRQPVALRADALPPTERWSLGILLGTLRRRWLVIAAAILASLGLSAFYVAATPPVFTAGAVLVMDTKRSPPSPTESAPDGLVDMAVVDSQVETIRSEKVALAVVDRLRLWDDPEFAGGGSGRLSTILTAAGLAEPPSPPTEAMKRQQAAAAFRRGLKIVRLGRSYVVELSFTALDPSKAATVANATAEAYIEDQLGAKVEVAQRGSDWMQGRIAELRRQSTDALGSVEEFKSRNNIIVDASGRLSSERELEELSTALARARAETAQAQARLERLEVVLARVSADPAATGVADPTVADALSNPVIVRLRQQYLDAARQEADWSARFGREHQAAVNLRAEMEALRRSTDSELGRIAETYRSELAIARAREASVAERQTQVFQLSGSVRQSQARLRELEAAAQSYRALYETFLNRYTQAVQQQSFPVTEARLVSRASPPLSKSAPKTSVVLLLGLLAGGGLGVVGAFGREYVDRKVRRPEQLERELGLRCLGLLPKVARRRFGGPLLVLNDRRRSPVAVETLRAVRIALEQGSRSGVGRVVAFASSLSGEGRTTLAYNLAHLTAESRRRTLLIDADLRFCSPTLLGDAKERAGTLTRILGVSGSTGLADVLGGTASLSEAVHRRDEGFDFLADAGAHQPPDSSDLLGSTEMRELIQEARTRYEYVVLDLPPMRDHVDALAVAGVVDAFVLVAERGRTSLDDVDRALTGSEPVAGRVVGFVLNKAKAAGIARR